MKKVPKTGLKQTPSKLTGGPRDLERDKSSSSPAPAPSTGAPRPASPAPPAVLKPPPRTGVSLRRAVRFVYSRPEAHAVHLVGSFNRWDPQATPMNRDSAGDWSVEIELPPGEHRYRLLVDGRWQDDPWAQQTVRNPFGGFDAVKRVV